MDNQPKELAVGDKIQTVQEAPVFNKEGEETGKEKLVGTVESKRRLKNGDAFYMCVIDNHGIVGLNRNEIVKVD